MSLASVSLISEFSSGFKECASPQIISQFYEPSVWVTQLRCITLMQLFWDISGKKFLKILCKLTLLTKQVQNHSNCRGNGDCLDRWLMNKFYWFNFRRFSLRSYPSDNFWSNCCKKSVSRLHLQYLYFFSECISVNHL